MQVDKRIIAATMGVGMVYGFARSAIAAFTPGNIAVLEVGTSLQQNTSGSAITIAEFSPGTTLEASPVNTYAVPTVTSGTNLGLTANTGANYYNQLSLSTNGQYLVFAGYNAAVGTAAINTTPTINTGIGIMDASGLVNTSTSITNRVNDQIVINNSKTPPGTFAKDSRTVTSAVMDGSNIWINSISQNPYEMGPQLTTLGTVGAPTQIGAPNSAPTTRNMTIYNGQLYTLGATAASAYSGSTGLTGNYYPSQQTIFGPAAVGSGLPTTPATWSEISTANSSSGTYSAPTNPTTPFAGFPTAGPSTGASTPISENSFAFANGGNTVYVTDSTYGLEKWNYNGTAWVFQWNTGLPVTSELMNDLTVETDGTNNYIYMTDLFQTGVNINTSQLQEFTDPVGSTSDVGSFNLISQAPAGETYYGVSVAPVPEPASLGMLGMAAGTLLGRRRRA